MSQKPTGLKAPSKIGRPTGLPQPKSGLQAPTKAQSPELQPGSPPTDDYKIGDFVYVGGTKGGRIAYIGETKFAPGEWAGVVLEDLVGKNDGSVAGVRYFQCEMKRGVFSRLAKLSKQPVASGIRTVAPQPASDASTDTASKTEVLPETPKPRPPVTTNGTVAPTPAATSTPKTVAATPRPSNLLKRGSISGSQTNLKSSPSGSVSSVPGDPRHGLKVGDRVLVSGTKTGQLRYIGATEFAKGEWVGVELDDPLGKNDGTVAGKRYFECKPLYGLFAPVHKVAKATGYMATPVRRSSISKLGMGLSSMSRERSGSQDSISSISSTTSNTSRSARAKNVGRPSPSTANINTSLQKALKEKEEHVEQLLRERDVERSELARTSAQADEAEGALLAMRSDYERLQGDMQNFKVTVEHLEREKTALTNQLEEEARKVEDLQFAVEEEAINKGDLESQSEIDNEKMKGLYKQLDEEITRANELQKQLDSVKLQHGVEQSKVSEAMESTDYYLDRIEELTHKLTQSEKKIKAFEEQKTEEATKASEVDEQLNQKNQHINEIQASLASRDVQLKELSDKLTQQQEELQEAKSREQKQKDSIDELMKKVASGDSSTSQSQKEIQELKSQLSELQRQLKASEDKTTQLADNKAKLEQQLEELTKNSGDSSQQLSLLAQQIRDRDRSLAEIQADLSSSTQRIGKLTETVETQREEAGREMEAALGKHGEHLKARDDQIQQLQKELEKANQKFTKTKESLEAEKLELQTKKDSELKDIREALAVRDEEVKTRNQEIKSYKENATKLQADLEESQFEKEKLEKSNKKLEVELSSLLEEKKSLVNEKEQLLSEQQKVTSAQGTSQEQVTQLQQEQSQLQTKLKQLETGKAAVESVKDELKVERDNLVKGRDKMQAELTARDTSLQEVVKQVEVLSTEFKKQKEQLVVKTSESQELFSAVENLKQHLSTSQKQCGDLEGRLKVTEQEKTGLQQQITQLEKAHKEKEQLAAELTEMKTQVNEQKQSSLMEDIESQTSALKGMVEDHQILLKKKDNQIATFQSQLHSLQEENVTLRCQTDTLEFVELEKSELEERVGQLESALEKSQANANITANVSGDDPVLGHLKKERDTFETQVQFLNSVIVDLQRKNDELKTRLEAMESGTVLNGNSDINMDISQTSRMIAPRMFCDICEVFDSHDTDDCPMQSMSESPPPSSYHGPRGDQRPYCDICEVFGHSTQECDDEQTF